ncbi:MAG: OsmC family protein [Gammaproteobacteria bacterium]|nr:OsmC family protein [Gammaproteobacteria bacterium]
MKASIEWTGDAGFMGKTGSGHSVQMDGPPDHGGKNLGPRPMEMLLLGLGGCAAFDVTLILRRGRQEIMACRAEIEAERAEEDPKVFTRIHMHFVIEGRDVDPKRVERAISLSAEKYCSASIMLAKTATISHDFEIVELSGR